MATIEELQQNITELSRRLEEKEKLDIERDEKIRFLENKPVQMDVLLDNTSKDVIEDVVDDALFDLVWKNRIHYTTFFESLDGYDKSIVGTGTATIDGGDVVLTTSAATNDSVQVTKTPLWTGLLTFSQRSNFRTAFVTAKGGGSFSNTEVYMIVGELTGNYYGFKVSSGTLYGVTRDGTTEKTISLRSYDETVSSLNLEARYSPGSDVIFIIDTVQKGIITTNLPSSAGVVNNAFVLFKIKTTETQTKTLQVSFFEYIQKRNVLKF